MENKNRDRNSKNQAEPILDGIVRKISAVRRWMPILYLVSEDREILFELFQRPDCFDIQRQTEDGQIVSCIYDRNLTGLNVIPVKTPSFSDGPKLGLKAHQNDFKGKTRYYYIRDFAAVERQSEYFIKYIEHLDKTGALYTRENQPLSENFIIISPAAPYHCIPSGFEQFVEVIDVPMIGRWEIAEMIAAEQNRALELMNRPLLQPEDFLNDNNYNNINNIPELNFCLEKCRGLNRQQVRQVFRQLAEMFGWVSRLGLSKQEFDCFPVDQFEKTADKLIYEQKRQAARKDGTIDFLPTEHLEKPGGMTGLCDWIAQKKKILLDPQRARQCVENFPRGILIAGLPGSGKSMIAKYIAHELNDMPLIRFQFSRILTGIVGGTEEKLDRALKRIEAAAPCVVWIDEIEKELGGTQGRGEADAGVASRCLATLLNWMQETPCQCLLCATANHIETLPAELLRRGRFDRKYYTFLPLQEQCVEIFASRLHQIAIQAPDLFSQNLKSNFIKLGHELFDEIAKLDRKFFTGADIDGLIQDAKSVLFQQDVPIPYDYQTFRAALIQTAQGSQPYGETNFIEVLDYWLALQAHPFLNAAVPEALRNQPEKYNYMLFDFSDFISDGTKWTWKTSISKRTFQHVYDRNLFDALKSGLENHKNHKNPTESH